MYLSLLILSGDDAPRVLQPSITQAAIKGKRLPNRDFVIGATRPPK